MKDIFTRIYQKNKVALANNEINLWQSKECVSGSGSDIKETKFLIKELPYILDRYNVKKILDLPCGDFNWMKEVNLNDIEYLGGDIVEELVKENQIKYPKYNFQVIDLVNDDLPKVDLILVRDCFIHLSNDSIYKAIINIKKSKIKYLLTTTFTNNINIDINDGMYRRINLLTHPFDFIPLSMFNELSGEATKKNKYLALFDTNDF